MPLPPAPTKRAALLPPEAFDAPARSSHKAARKTEARRSRSRCAERPQAPDDFDLRAGGGDAAAPARTPPTIETDAGAAAAGRKTTAVTAPRRSPRKKRGQRPGQAVRARHQRADARPDEPVPLRGARHLPADDHARGARRPQERHDRSRAQRAPGQPRRSTRSSPAAQRDADIADGMPLDKHRPPRGRRHACSSRPTLIDVELPAGLPQGKADNQILGVVQALREQHAARATSCWCPRTSTCASRRARWAWPPRTTSTTRCSRTPTCSTPASLRAAGRLLGQARQDDGDLAAGRPHLLPHQRPARAQRC